MGMLAPQVSDGGLVRRLAVGDILASAEPPIPATDTTNTTLALTAGMLLNSTVYVRNPAGVSTDTFPSADALITGLSAGIGAAASMVQNLTFRWMLVNLSANVITGAVNANTGVTLVRGVVGAGSVGSSAGTKTFLVAITNATPLRSVVGIGGTNASAVLTGFSAVDLQNLSVGMVVTNAVANLQGQTIIGINAASGTVTMSGAANATGVISLTFSPTYTVTGLSL